MKNILLLLIGCLFSLPMLQAAAISWDGGASTTSWNDGANWSGNAVPSATDDVTIGSFTVSIPSGNAVANSITLTGTASLTLASGATLSISNTAVAALDLQGTSTFTNNGTVTFTNNGGNTVKGNAAIELNAIGTTLQNNATGTINITNPKRQGIASLSLAGTFTFNNAGAINITNTNSGGAQDGEGIDLRGQFNFTNGGTITLDDIDIGDAAVNFIGGTGAETRSNTGTIRLTNSPTALFFLGTQFTDLINTGTLKCESDIPFLFQNGALIKNQTGGNVQGIGTIDVDTFQDDGGSITPGLSPGILTFDASENLSKSIWAIEINGTGVAGTNYDQIKFTTGTATLGGTRTLNVAFNFTPSVGNQFTIFSGTASGTFTTINVTPAHTVTFTPATGILEVTVVLPVELVRVSKI